MATLTVTVQALRGHVAIGQQEEDGVLPLDRPVETGGTGLGFNGGHLVLLGWGACYKSTLVAAAKSRDIDLRNLTLTIRGEMADAPSRITAVHMEVELDADTSEEDKEKLVTIAKNGCAVSNTLALAADMHVELVRTGN